MILVMILAHFDFSWAHSLCDRHVRMNLINPVQLIIIMRWLKNAISIWASCRNRNNETHWAMAEIDTVIMNNTFLRSNGWNVNAYLL